MDHLLGSASVHDDSRNPGLGDVGTRPELEFSDCTLLFYVNSAVEKDCSTRTIGLARLYHTDPYLPGLGRRPARCDIRSIDISAATRDSGCTFNFL